MKDLKKVMVVALIGTVAFFAQDALEVVEMALGGMSWGYTFAIIAVLVVMGLTPEKAPRKERQSYVDGEVRQEMVAPIVTGYESRVGRSSIDIGEMAFFDSTL